MIVIVLRLIKIIVERGNMGRLNIYPKTRPPSLNVIALRVDKYIEKGINKGGKESLFRNYYIGKVKRIDPL